jgi:hypothetical protein
MADADFQGVFPYLVSPAGRTAPRLIGSIAGTDVGGG